MLSRFVIVVLSLTLVISAQASNRCESLFGQSKLTPAGTIFYDAVQKRIATPESEPMLRAAVEHLEDMIGRANQPTSLEDRIYQAAVPKMQALLEYGQELVRDGLVDQDQVAEFTSRYSHYVDLSRRYLSHLGEHTGQNLPRPLRESDIDEIFSDYRRYYGDPLGRSLSHFIEKYERRSRGNKLDLKAPFAYLSLESRPIPEMAFKFQYQYIFTSGVIPLRPLFENRESGRVFVGVPEVAETEFDRSKGNSFLFQRHDVIHAYLQKYFDHVVFEQLGIAEISQMKIFKSRTDEKLRMRVAEYLDLTDRTLRDSIEIVYFYFLHEQGRSYPFGVIELNRDKASFDLHVRRLESAIRSKAFGDEYSSLALERSRVAEAIFWVLSRARLDAKSIQIPKKQEPRGLPQINLIKNQDL